MYSCAVACSARKWNLHVGCISSLYRVHLKVLNCHTASNNSLGFNRYFDREGTDTVAACDFLGLIQQFQPFMLLLSRCLHSGANRQHRIVQNSRCLELTETFRSFCRKFSFTDKNNDRLYYHYCTQGNCQFEHAAVLANAIVPDFCCHSMVHDKRLDTRMWPVLKHVCLPVPSTDNLLSSVHQRFTASHSFHNSTDSLSQKPEKDSSQKPSAIHLSNVQQLMMDQIPKIFLERHEYRIYTPDLVFENNWNIEKPSRKVGIGRYVMAVVKARFHVRFKYASVKVSVLSSSIDESLGCVQFHWRISVLPQIKAFMFWKFKPFKIRKTAAVESEWLEGRSTFYVNNKGFIYRHVLDRTISDAGESPIVQKDAAAAVDS